MLWLNPDNTLPARKMTMAIWNTVLRPNWSLILP